MLRRSIGGVLELVGACLVGGGFVSEWYSAWYFANNLGPFAPHYRTLLTYEAVSGYLLLVGVLIVGAGWTAKRLRSDPPPSSSGTGHRWAVVLVLTAAALFAAGLFLIAYPESAAAASATVSWPSWTVGLGYLPMAAGAVLWGTACVAS